ncbi:MAG TPA: TlpA disulfide reductase family protein [Steroidobacteraceae bacterium]
MSPGAAASPARGLLLGIVLIAAAGAAGFLLYRLGSPAQTLYPDPTPVTAHALAEGAPHAADVRKIPEAVPAISLPGLDGHPHALADYRGKLLVVNFWATWCDPCRREIPLLKSLRGEYAKDGLEIVGIAVDSREEVAKYAVSHGITYPVLLGERGGLEAAGAFGMEVVLPFSVFADRAGHIVALKVGELRPDEAHTILAGLRELDAGHLTLKAAQAQIAASLAAVDARHTGGTVPAQN